MARPPGSYATPSDMLDAARKLDDLANEVEQTRKEIGGAATSTALLIGGFTLGPKSITTCGQVGSCLDEMIKDMRRQAKNLRDTAAAYTELDRQAQTSVTVV